jgi:hypothetical protein
MDNNFVVEENKLTKELFDLDEILSFQLDNDVKVIRGEDWMYLCYINGEVYGTGLTPMYALVIGIRMYKFSKS